MCILNWMWLNEIFIVEYFSEYYMDTWEDKRKIGFVSGL